jgi:hypothetical protein
MQFFERNEELLSQEKARLDKEADTMGCTADILYCKAGVTMVRILPPYSAAGAFYHNVYLHRVKIGGATKIFPCPSQDDLACAICAKGESLYNTHDETLLRLAKDLRPRDTYLYNVICFGGPPDGKGNKPEFGKIYVLQGGVMIHRQIMSLDRDEATGWANITDPENGVNLAITRTGMGMMDTRYTVLPTGMGRSNIWNDLQLRSIDPNAIELYALDQVYPMQSQEDIETMTAKLTFVPSGSDTVSGPIPVVSTFVPRPTPVPAPAPNMLTPVPAVVDITTPTTTVATPPTQPVVATPLPTPVATGFAQAPVAVALPVAGPAPARVPLVAPTAQPATPDVRVQVEVPAAPTIPPPPEPEKS